MHGFRGRRTRFRAASFVQARTTVYERKNGVDLTIEAFEPAKKNGAAILCIAGSGYSSDQSLVDPALYAELLKRGCTVLAIVHRPRSSAFIPDMEEDVGRAVQFVKKNASVGPSTRTDLGCLAIAQEASLP